jgi:GUN4-like/Trypsin-like peptidase domain
MSLENREWEFEVFKSAIARLHHASGSVVGVGFLVSDRYLLTCAHVVTSALGIPQNTQEMPSGFVELDFLVASGQKVKSKVTFWQPVNPSQIGEDIAGLVLEDALPEGVQPLRLMSCGNFWGHQVRILGFPKEHRDGIWATGTLRDKQAQGWVQFDGIASQDRAIEKGFSGAPIWDETVKGVVGMAVAAEKRREDVTAAFMIPTSILSAIWSNLIPVEPLTSSMVESQEITSKSDFQQRRLKTQLEHLQEEWELRSEKLKKLRLALAIETETAVRFQLEYRIQAEEIQLERLTKRLNKLEQPQSFNNNLPHPLTPLQANYEQLRTFLEAEAWKEADLETIRVILQVAKKQKDGWLKSKDIDNFSCSDLCTIDQLWLDASRGQFGFSVQRRIWLDVNGQLGKFDPETFRNFGDCVSWRVNDDWIRHYKELDFSSVTPEGHFPSLRFPRAEDGMNWFETWKASFRGFLTRVDSCL